MATDLIVVGSHGRNALARTVLGSVSQKVLTEASTSVHVGRPNPGRGNSAQRILIGVDGSPGAMAAVGDSTASTRHESIDAGAQAYVAKLD